MDEGGELLVVAGRQSRHDRRTHFAAVAVAAMAPGAPALEHLSSGVVLATEQSSERNAGQGSDGDQS